VYHFSYLGCIISFMTLKLNSESILLHQPLVICQSIFHLQKPCTKMAVYKAAFISTLVCGCEYWTTYRSHIRNLESFHIRCLRRILGLTWADRVAHTTILESTGCLSIECLIISQQLRWIGHVIRMPENRLLRKLFYRELIRGHHIPSSQKKRYRDHLHSILKLFNIP